MDTQFNEPANKNKIKAPKLLSYQIRKRYYKTLWINTKHPIIPYLPELSDMNTVER